MEEQDPHPTFLVGAPRSGTTLLLDFLTVPREAAWISRRLGRNPSRLGRSSEVRRLGWPLLGEFWLERRHAWKGVPEPAEGPEFWEHYLRNFSPPAEAPFVPGPDHLADEEAERLREAVREVCRGQRRLKFVGQYSGFPRVAMMRSVFPGAKFIQLMRDPRSVAYRMARKIGKDDPDLWENRHACREIMPAELRARLDELEDTPLNFSGVFVRWLHNLYREELEALPEADRMEIAYADLMARPKPTLKRALAFVDLPFDKRFKYYLKYHPIQEGNRRTKRNLSRKEAEQLAEAVK